MLLPLVFGVVLVLVGVTASALVAVASAHIRQVTLRGVVSRIDKAVKSGALHRNNGARKKARASRIRSGLS